MQEDTEALAGAADAETAPDPANDTAQDTGTEQTPPNDADPQPETTAKPDAEAEPKADEQPKRTPWFQRRIDDLTREKWEARREADTWKALATAGGQKPKPEGEGVEWLQRQAPQQPESQINEAEIRRMAAEMAATERFNESCNKIYDQGTKEIPDFGSAIDTLRQVGLTNELIEAALEAGQDGGGAHKILYQLGKDPDEAARILSLSPIRMAAAVAKLGAKPAPTAKPLSSAPAPIKPIGGQGRVETDPEKMSMAEWEKRHPLPSR